METAEPEPERGEAEAAARRAQSQASVPGTWRGKGRFWLPVAPLLALDLVSKHEVFTFLAARYPWVEENSRKYEVWRWGWLDFHLVSWGNPGTIWGLGQDFTPALVGLRCVVIAVIVWFVWRRPQPGRAMLLVLGVILAGALGNLYDNVTRWPKADVRDFLRFTGDWWGWQWEWPAFNVADSCICVGALTFAALLWHADARARAAAAPARPVT